MHEQRIAHRGACTFNLMVDSANMVPDGNLSFFRPDMKEDWKNLVDPVEQRFVAPLKYYFIDFETTCMYIHSR
ncbi:hypothetical protein BDN70DRAFT_666945 [Pholiota conissans]|uniref:Uncharacterized protein n=1 Tax=Pholiota conissans TaxID=109636 RepID=A0A9P5Z1Q2_9AGAR|nr:hypothetical protein BDN70DRAFT_666945 [Pholiota conissans]